MFVFTFSLKHFRYLHTPSILFTVSSCRMTYLLPQICFLSTRKASSIRCHTEVLILHSSSKRSSLFLCRNVVFVNTLLSFLKALFAIAIHFPCYIFLYLLKKLPIYLSILNPPSRRTRLVFLISCWQLDAMGKFSSKWRQKEDKTDTCI